MLFLEPRGPLVGGREREDGEAVLRGHEDLRFACRFRCFGSIRATPAAGVKIVVRPSDQRTW